MERYTPAWKLCPDGNDMDKDPDGDWVAWSEVLALLKEATMYMPEEVPKEIRDLVGGYDY